MLLFDELCDEGNQFHPKGGGLLIPTVLREIAAPRVLPYRRTVIDT